MPTNCAYTDSNKESIHCQDGQRSLDITFDAINDFWEYDISDVCDSANKAWSQCNQ